MYIELSDPEVMLLEYVLDSQIDGMKNLIARYNGQSDLVGPVESIMKQAIALRLRISD